MKKLFSILFLAFFWFAAYSQPPAFNTFPDPSAEGNVFPEISLKTLDGKIINNKTFEKKIVVISLGFRSCPPCKAKMKGLNQLYDKYKGNNNIVFFYVSTDDAETAKKYRSEHNVEYPMVSITRDERSLFCKGGSPATIIINKKGKVIYKKSGGGFDEKKVTQDLMEKVAPIIDKELAI